MSTEPVSDERLRQAVRDVLAEELDQNGDQPSATRRQVLGSIAAGGVLGGIAGAGSAAGATNTEGTNAMVGALAGPPYQWADPGGYSGPASAESSISNSVGQVYLAQDTGETLYDDGSSFAPLDRAAPNLQSKERPVVDVTHPDFGAVGDGSTDDQAAIQAAVDYAESLSAPSVVYFPRGEYYIGDTGGSASAIRARFGDVVLAGDGPEATVLLDHFDSGGSSTDDGKARFIRMGGTSTSSFSPGDDTGATNVGDSYDYVGVRDLRIENLSGFDGNTISLEDADRKFVHNVAIDNSTNSDSPGLPVAAGFEEDNQTTTESIVTGCFIRAEHRNNKSIEVSGVRRAVVDNNVIHATEDASNPGSCPSGISVVSCERVAITGNSIETAQFDAPCIQVLGAQRASIAGNSCYGGNHSITIGSSRAFDSGRVSISGNYCETPATDGIRIDSPSSWVNANGNLIHSPGQDGISWATVSGLQFVGNQIVDAGRYGITNDRGAQQFRQAMVVGNLVRAPAQTGIVIQTPTTGGGVIAMNHVSNIGDASEHILVDNVNGAPSDFVLLGNNCTRGGSGITVNGTPSNFVQADNNT